MAWKDSVNSVLSRSTGHRLVKHTNDVDLRAAADAAALAEAKITRLKQRHRAELRAQLAQQRASFLARSAVTGADPLLESVRHLGTAGIGGDLVEVGARTGDVTELGTVVAEAGGLGRRLHRYAGALAADAPEHIALARIEVTSYDAAARVLDDVWARLVPGGVLVVDDRGCDAAADAAIRDWATASGDGVLLVPTASGRVGVKPR